MLAHLGEEAEHFGVVVDRGLADAAVADAVAVGLDAEMAAAARRIAAQALGRAMAAAGALAVDAASSISPVRSRSIEKPVR